MKEVRNAIVLVDAYRSWYRRRRITAGRYRVGAKTEKEAEMLVRKAIGFGSVKFYYWDNSDSKKVDYKEVVRDFTYEKVKHATAPAKINSIRRTHFMDISNVIKDLFTALDNFVKATGLRYDYENNDYKTDVELDADMEMLASIENAHSDLSYYLGINSQSSNENEEVSDIRYVIDNADADKTAVYMTEILTDPNISTYKMLEGLASEYLSGNAEFKKGIDTACMALTGESMTDIAKNIRNIHENEE